MKFLKSIREFDKKTSAIIELILLTSVIVFFETLFLIIKLRGNFLCDGYQFNVIPLIIFFLILILSIGSLERTLSREKKNSLIDSVFRFNKSIIIIYCIVRRIIITLYHKDYCGFTNYGYYILADLILAIIFLELVYNIVYQIKTKHMVS